MDSVSVGRAENKSTSWIHTAGVTAKSIGRSIGKKLDAAGKNLVETTLEPLHKDSDAGKVNDKTCMFWRTSLVISPALASTGLASIGLLKAIYKGPKPKGTEEIFPKMLSDVKFMCKLGGSTGAEKVQYKGISYAKKTTGKKITPDHLRSEYHTNKAYKALGVKVPEVVLYNTTTSARVKAEEMSTEDEPVMLSKFVPEKAQDVNEFLGLKKPIKLNSNSNGIHISKSFRDDNAEQIKLVQNAFKQNFVADCLLANWDVVGLEMDNVKYDPKTNQIWRIDNGSGLEFRAQGGLKGGLFGATINEFESLRDPKINPNTAFLLETLTDEDIIAQIDAILPKREAFLATIPDHLQDVMSQRFDYLSTYRETLTQKTSSSL